MGPESMILVFWMFLYVLLGNFLISFFYMELSIF